MRYSPRNIEIAFGHAGLTHYGGILFFNEFSRMLQLRRFLTRHLHYPRRNHDYKLSQMILALIYPIILGLDRLETASLLRSNGTFQYLTGLASYPGPQSLRRFLLQAAPHFREQLHRVNDCLLQYFIHRPDHRSRLILDLDSTVVTVFGHQEGAAVGYNPRYRGKRSYIHCFVWKRTPRSSGMWNCDAAMRAPGRAARNCWPAVFIPPLPIFVSWTRFQHFQHWPVAEACIGPHPWLRA
jgi:hypothetical protein